MKTEITFKKSALKDLRTCPRNIIDSLKTWISYIERIGLAETRKIPGHNDEALSGKRKGQRSARLNKAYRVIYILSSKAEIEIVQIIEINKHKY